MIFFTTTSSLNSRGPGARPSPSRTAARYPWKNLKDAAPSALDCRIAAEILLLFDEDLAAGGQAESQSLPDIPRNGWHPLHERLS
jgi:hypothetical protein